MRLSTRIVLAMLCLIVLTGTAVGSSAYFRLRQALVPSELARMGLHARQIAQGVESDVRGALGNVLTLSYTKPLHGFIRARSSGGTDPETGVAGSEWKMRLNAIFLAHIQAEPTYSRIRIVGTADDGKELLRVERDHQTGEVRTVPENELQVKGYRNFFLDTLAVQPGKVDLSRLDLNQDYGAILEPHLPTLRASTSVLAPDGSVFGIVIINVDMRPTLDRIRASAPPYGRIMLLDEEGNYLVHPDPAQEFGFDLGKPRRITDDWQELRQAAWPASSLREIMTGPGGQHEALVLESFRLGGVLPLYVAKSVPYDVVMAPALTVRDSTIMTILVATLLAMLLSIFLARTLTRPIERMARALLKSTDSEDELVPGGELEQLNKAFQTMRAQAMEIAEALALKTEEQSETSRALSDSLGQALRFSAAVESSGDAIITTRADGKVNGWNPAAQQLFGIPREEAMGRDIRDLFPLAEGRSIAQLIASVVSGSGIEHEEALLERGDGKRVDVSITASPVKSPSGEVAGISFIVRDNSEHRSIAAQLRQAQKMEAIGRLAGGVAHDFNNLLTVIIGCTELLMETSKEDKQKRDLLGEVHQAGLRAAGLTRQLLAFSRRSIVTITNVRVDVLLQEMEKMLLRLIGEDVEVTLLSDPGLPPVRVDASQFEQVVMNLVVNARDAMPTGGKLIIETRMVHLDEEYADDHVEVEPGDYVVLSVSDNGTGMDHDTRLRIFDPFFTTKEQGKGTGLGLSTVYGIVKQSGGHISCYSEPGRGTTFKIYLPVAERGDSVHQKGAAVNLEDCKGDEKILLVEDEEAVRAMAKRVLSRAGYTIVEAKDGKEVAERIAELDGPVHLILTDVVLPTLSGREVAEAVRVIYPQAKVLFASGYTDDAIVRYGVLRSEMPFLHKPFTPQALLRKVREVLDSPRSAD